MKYIVKLIAVVGIIFLSSGCSTSSQAKLGQMNSEACNSPKCECPKPCQCGSSCQCGSNRNSQSMNGG